MKTKSCQWFTVLTLLVLATINSSLATLFAQGTAFTYQGRLNAGTNAANGSYDLQFALFNTFTTGTGTQQGNLLTNSATAVTNGLFTVQLDFGNQFPGAPRWLEIGVRSNGVATFTPLTPREPLTPAPYAFFANTASNLSGALPAAQLSGTLQNSSLPASPTFSGAVTANSFSGNGASVTGVNAASLNGLGAANFWQTGGNGGTTPGVNFLGTTDNQPLEFHVNGQRGLRLEYGGDGTIQSVNVIGGHSGNSVSSGVYGATIAGGGDTFYFEGTPTPHPNEVSANFGTIGGGTGNTVSGTYGTVSGGSGNTASGSSGWGAVGGGYDNTASGYAATVAGGGVNAASGDFSFAAGFGAQAINRGTFVWADSQNGNFFSTNDNSFNVRASGGARFVTSGAGMSVDGSLTIAGVTSYNNGLKLTGNGSIGTGIAIENTAAGGHKFDLISSAASANIGAGGFGIFDETGGDYRFVVNSNGNVGIGTYSPANKLDVQGSADFTGNVGIGTANPGSLLTVNGSGSAAISLIGSGSNGQVDIGIASFATAYSVSAVANDAVIRQSGKGKLFLQTGSGTAAITITTNNNVGIGTSTPTNTLQVNGTVAASALRAPGAGINTGTFAFIQRATAANTVSDSTIINNPLCDGDPNAILIVTHNLSADTNSTSQFNTKPVGVFYSGANWVIFNEDGTGMALGRAFNVMVVKP
jgi:hypothetical protein